MLNTYQSTSSGNYKTEYNILGTSYMGNVIYDVVITPAKYNQTMLITFAVHGFDGGWYRDGSTLVQIANDIIREFSNNPGELNSTRLIVVPCVNPDGIMYGQSENGIGRCNGQGVDINRDFDFNWKYCSEDKYHTGKTPFSTTEAQILRDLVLNEKPDIVVDFHGWQNSTLGDEQLAKYFNDALKIGKICNDYEAQTFSGWASKYARSVLVEYTDPKTPWNVVQWGYSQKTIKAIKAICSAGD